MISQLRDKQSIIQRSRTGCGHSASARRRSVRGHNSVAAGARLPRRPLIKPIFNNGKYGAAAPRNAPSGSIFPTQTEEKGRRGLEGVVGGCCEKTPGASEKRGEAGEREAAISSGRGKSRRERSKAAASRTLPYFPAAPADPCALFGFRRSLIERRVTVFGEPGGWQCVYDARMRKGSR